MREFIDIISESSSTLLEDAAGRRTKTRTKSPLDLNLGTPGVEQPLATVDTGRVSAAPKRPRAARNAAASNADAHAIIGDASARIRQKTAGHALNIPNVADEISDAEAMRRRGMDTAAPAVPGMANPRRLGREQGRLAGPAGTALALQDEPRTVENLPAVVRTEIAELGEEPNPVKWLQIKQLPGYMQQGIRAIGRRVFQQFTHDFPMEDIQMICTITHPEAQVRQMFELIGRSGRKLDEVTMDFNDVMQGLVANVVHMSWAGYEWLLMKDMGGYYVYGWPADTKDRIAPDVDDDDDDFAPPRRLR